MRLYIDTKHCRGINGLKMMCNAIGAKTARYCKTKEDQFINYAWLYQEYVSFPLLDGEMERLFNYYIELMKKGKYIFHMLENEVNVHGERLKSVCLLYGIDKDKRTVDVLYKGKSSLKKMTMDFEEYFIKIPKGYQGERFNKKFVFNTLKKVEE